MNKTLKELIALFEQKLEELRLTGGLLVKVLVLKTNFTEIKRCKTIRDNVIQKLEEIEKILKNCEDKNLDRKIIDCINHCIKNKVVFPYVGKAQFFDNDYFIEDELPYLFLLPEEIKIAERETLLCKDVDENKGILYILHKDRIREKRIEMPYLAIGIDPEAEPVKKVEDALNNIHTVGLLVAIKAN